MRWSSQINFYSTLGVLQHFQLTEQKLPSFLHFLLLLCCRTNIGCVRHLLLLSRTKEENSTQHSPVLIKRLCTDCLLKNMGEGITLIINSNNDQLQLFLLFCLFSCKFTSQFLSLHQGFISLYTTYQSISNTKFIHMFVLNLNLTSPVKLSTLHLSWHQTFHIKGCLLISTDVASIMD